MKRLSVFARCQTGGRTEGGDEAWRDFFAEFDPLIVSVVSWPKWRFTPDVRDDLTQTIRSELVKALPRFRESAKPETFMRRICVNRCIDEVRRQVRERGVMTPWQVQDREGEWVEPQTVAGPEFDPIATILKMERATGLRRALEALDETCRLAIREFYVEDVSYKEIADRHGIAVNTVGSRLAKCLQKLRKALANDPEFADLQPDGNIPESAATDTVV